ncbi:MAG TPA: hypothetical protein VNW29_04650 [Candidatus Sulfotelmatobacter sp.]|jgi:hypothetical protein|nr:hypothetical protein [Candidatus Sulfotelmatobacter sp.]
MKLLSKLEKKQQFWWITICCLSFFFLRLPSIIEPYWYGDEGIYEVIGQAMNHGRILYRDIWDNKPPFLYIIYALAQGDQPTVKILSLVFGLLSLIVFFFFSQKLFNKLRISISISIIYTILLGTPLLEGNIANAENFILLPILIAGLLIYKLSFEVVKAKTKHKIYIIHSLLAGLLLGIALLFKIVAIFDVAAFLFYLILINVPEKITWAGFQNAFKHIINTKYQKSQNKSLLLIICFLFIGLLIPFVITVPYFIINHAFYDFYQSAFSGNVDYVGWQNSLLGIPQGLLLLKFIVLIVAIIFIYWKRKYFTKSSLFITIWLVFSLFNVYFSGRPYTHYAIILLPSFCLFIGLFFISHTIKKRLSITAGIVLVSIMLMAQFHYNIIGSYQYYQNALQFVTDRKSVQEYETFFDQKVPRDYAIASFITTHTKPSDNVFIWGNNAQIYALAHKLPPIKYTVAYHITQNNTFNEIQKAITQQQLKYIIVLKESQPLPFAAPLYIMRYNIEGTTIYERNF